MKINLPLLMVFTSILLFFGCAGSIGEKYILNQEEKKKYETISPETAITDASATLMKAKENQLGFYSPVNYKNAEETLKEAKEIFNKNQTDEKIIKNIAAANHFIKQGNAVKEMVLKNMGDLIELFSLLKNMKSDTRYPYEFKNIETLLSVLILLAEKNDIDTAMKKKPSIIDQMLALKIIVIKENVLSESQAILNAIKVANYILPSPTPYNEATEAINKADIFIRTNHNDTEGIQKVANKARAMALRAKYLTDRVIYISSTKKEELEKIALEEESLLQKISSALELQDKKDLSINDQSVFISEESAQLLLKYKKALEEKSALDKNISEHEKSEQEITGSMKSGKEKIQELEKLAESYKIENAMLQNSDSLGKEKIQLLEKQVREMAVLENTNALQLEKIRDLEKQIVEISMLKSNNQLLAEKIKELEKQNVNMNVLKNMNEIQSAKIKELEEKNLKNLTELLSQKQKNDELQKKITNPVKK